MLKNTHHDKVEYYINYFKINIDPEVMKYQQQVEKMGNMMWKFICSVLMVDGTNKKFNKVEAACRLNR